MRLTLLGVASLLMGLSACAVGPDSGAGGPGGSRSGPGIGGADEEGAGGEGTMGPGGSKGGRAAPPGAGDLPWEVRSERGETYVPNVFYADPTENEQVMPTALDGHAQINRLIYPTLGNPNLYVKDDPTDSFMIVLRLEEDAYQQLAPTETAIPGTDLRALTLTQNDDNRLSFYLVSREARAASTETEGLASPGPGVTEIVPSQVLVHPVPADMPEELRGRRTLRVVFRTSAMKDVAPGLFDVRFEARRDGQLVRAVTDSGIHEYQYNALRVFDHAPVNDEYQILSVTDTQVSVGQWYSGKTQLKLKDFVDYVNASTDPVIRDSAFITFNGDLHNGGSPGGFREQYVATTYNEESKVIMASLKELHFPIFLTAGNHDGYSSTGTVPGAVKLLDAVTFGSMEKTVSAAYPKAWPDFSWGAFENYRSSVAATPGGFHRDLFTGRFSRHAGAKDFTSGFTRVPDRDRNMVLYDGFHQWQRTYGPLYYSWAFGKNFYTSVNSYDLRQHRRSGWGMYTVNYGGGMSEVQMEWLRREMDTVESQGKDLVVLAHHDPRGGHRGKDLGYYFAQVDYRGVAQSTFAYLEGKILPATVCKLPTWAVGSLGLQSDCLHDGLSEWMRADPEFDCNEQDKFGDGSCDQEAMSPTLPKEKRHLPVYSGYELIDALTTHTRARTLVLGHTHYNSLEMLQSGDEMLPAKTSLDDAQAKALAALEIQNPVRGYSWLGNESTEYDVQALGAAGIVMQNGQLFIDVTAQAQKFNRVIMGDKRELAVVRLTSNADLTSQSYRGLTMLGFSVLHVGRKNDARAYDLPQINRATFFINEQMQELFDQVKTVDIDRTVRMGPQGPGNPVDALFTTH